MPRSIIAGSGSWIPPNRVTNDMLSRIMDTSDDWIRERSGILTRYFVDEGTATSDVALAASRNALEMAGIGAQDLDLIVFATMTPDYLFPGSGGLLQAKLGARDIPCFDIRQQCSGFVYGMQMADAHIRAGLARNVLLVGAEVHIGFMPWTRANYDFMFGKSDIPPTPEEHAWNTRFRHLTVLFGDGGAAVVIRAREEAGRGIVDSVLHADGSDYQRLFVPGTGFRHRPYVDHDQLRRGDHIPVMDGRHIFKYATARMAGVAREILERNGVSPDSLSLVLMHQANLRINDYVRQALGIPAEKAPTNIERYGNTTAATIPLLWDECARDGRIRPGDLVLMVAFGAGLTWGAVLLRA